MIENFADRYRRWFAYEQDCHAKALASLTTVPDAHRAAPAFQQTVDLLAHIVAARWVWLHRFGAAPEAPREFFPQGLSVDELRERVDAMHTAWVAYLEPIDDVELARTFTYRSSEGPWFSNTVEDIFTQLFGHAWYHRGQIAALVRSLGGTPAATDFVFWTRTPAKGPSS